jgi:hypothetical protein
MVDKVAVDQLFSEYFPANSHSTYHSTFIIIIIIRGWYIKPISG